MKPLDPKTFEGAIDRVKGALGVEGCAVAVGKSESLVRKWADSDHDVLPNLRQAQSLDAAYQDAGLGQGPILSVYSKTLGKPTFSGLGDVLSELLDISPSHGDLAAAVRDALRPDGAGGQKITPNEAQKILKRSSVLIDEIEQVMEAVRLEAGFNIDKRA